MIIVIDVTYAHTYIPVHKDNHKFDEKLGNTNFDELNNMYPLINEQQDASEELLDVASAPADDATGTMGMPLPDGKCGNTCVEVDLCHLAMPRSLFQTHHLPCPPPPYVIEVGIYL